MKKIETKKGMVYLVNSDDIGVHRDHYFSKKEFEKKVVSTIVDDLLGLSNIVYDTKGAPSLENSKYRISISHSSNLFAIYLSIKCEVGVDVEIINRDVEKGKSYFLNEDELRKEWTKGELYIIWSAKESYYKEKKGDISDLREMVTVKEISNNKVKLLHGKLTRYLEFILLDNLVLVYT